MCRQKYSIQTWRKIDLASDFLSYHLRQSIYLFWPLFITCKACKQYLQGLKIPNAVRFVKLLVQGAISSGCLVNQALIVGRCLSAWRCSDMGAKEWSGETRVCFILKSQISAKNLKYFSFFLVQKTRLVSGLGYDHVFVSSVSPLYLEGNVTGKNVFCFQAPYKFQEEEKVPIPSTYWFVK